MFLQIINCMKLTQTLRLTNLRDDSEVFDALNYGEECESNPALGEILARNVHFLAEKKILKNDAYTEKM